MDSREPTALEHPRGRVLYFLLQSAVFKGWCSNMFKQVLLYEKETQFSVDAVTAEKQTGHLADNIFILGF